MNWKEYYKSRCIALQEAADKIKSGDRVVCGHAAGEPSSLVDAMVKNRDKYKDVEIVHMVCMGKGEYCKPEMAEHFRHNSLFVGGPTRDAVYEGRGDFTPSYLSEIPRLFREGYMEIDVTLVQVSPPDKHGYCSLGISVDYTRAAVDCGKIVIAEVNDQMPRTLGEALVHVTDLDYFVEVSHPIIELQPSKITDVEKAIGENCASLVEDGSTLQLGIGSLPDALLMFLDKKKDLGIHSEMISDGVANLIEAGVITNKRKTLHRNKCVVAFLMGTRKLYDYVDNNPLFHMAPVEYVNNPVVIMQNYKMVSINSCVQVDLMGQVVSECIGLKQISAVGGQVDFIRGANMAPGGKAIIAMPSTLSGGKISKIVPFLDHGAAVTTNRYDVNYVVTEYGIAQLRGKTLRDRAKALIGIAHPDFRPQLNEEWERRFGKKS